MSRKFEQTKLTDMFVDALEEALVSLRDIRLKSPVVWQQILSYENMIKKIKHEKLDVRLVSRED